MKIPTPDKLPKNMTEAQTKAVILEGIVNPNYPDQADEVISWSKPSATRLVARVRDGKKLIDFEIDGDEVSYGLADVDSNAEFAEPDADDDTVDAFIDRLAKAARPSVNAMVESIKNLYAESDSEVEFAEKLQEAYPALEGKTLTRIMAEAMTASRLSGIFEAEDDG